MGFFRPYDFSCLFRRAGNTFCMICATRSSRSAMSFLCSNLPKSPPPTAGNRNAKHPEFEDFRIPPRLKNDSAHRISPTGIPIRDQKMVSEIPEALAKGRDWSPPFVPHVYPNLAQGQGRHICSNIRQLWRHGLLARGRLNRIDRLAFVLGSFVAYVF